MSLSVTIEGLDELEDRLKEDILGPSVRRLLTRVAITGESGAKKRARVDTGRMRTSIAHEVDNGPFPIWAKFGTNVRYAPYQEYGTGEFAEGPGPRKGGRGGIRPNRFLRGGAEDAQARVDDYIRLAEREIEEAATR